ncbi:T9SS type A sorting domain-containing protein, partial [bacterium]|nr:T9SS type A sorting domain-containing protein [bacterium]
IFRWNWYDSYWDWMSQDLWNGDVRAMTSRGSQPFAGTFGAGVFRLEPGNDSWSHASSGLTASLARCLVWDGLGLYVGTVGSGVYVSGDRGATWVHSIDGLGELNVHELASDASGVYAANWNGVWKTGNHGVSWSASGLQGNGIFALEEWLARLYAGTFTGVVWSSGDGGQNWDQEGSGLPSACVQDVVRIGTDLYAALMGQGVWVLPDGETTWAAMSDGLPVLDPWSLTASGGDLFVGLDNNGVYRWNGVSGQWDATVLDYGTIFFLHDVGSLLLAGSWGALYASDDAGATWSDVHDGLEPWLGVHAVASAGDDWFAALDNGGVWRASLLTAVEDPGSGAQAELSLDVLKIHPNPFSAGARIAFTLDRPQRVRLAVYDVAGRRVATLVDDDLDAGPQERVWDGATDAGGRAAAGVYIVRLEAGGKELVAKTINLR